MRRIYLICKELLSTVLVFSIVLLSHVVHAQTIMSIEPDLFDTPPPNVDYTQFNYPITPTNQPHHLKKIFHKTYIKSTQNIESVSNIDINLELGDKTLRSNQPNNVIVYAFQYPQAKKMNMSEFDSNPVSDELFMQLYEQNKIQVLDIIDKVVLHVSVFPLGDYPMTPDSEDFPKTKVVQTKKLDDGRFVATINTQKPGYYTVRAMVTGAIGTGAKKQVFFREAEDSFKVIEFPLSNEVSISDIELENERLSLKFKVQTTEKFSLLTEKTAYLSGELWATSSNGQLQPAIAFSGLSDASIEGSEVIYKQSVAGAWLKKLNLKPPLEIKKFSITLPGFYYLSMGHDKTLSPSISDSITSAIKAIKFDGQETEDMLLGYYPVKTLTKDSNQQFNLFYVPDLCSDSYGEEVKLFYDDKTLFLAIDKIPVSERKHISISQYARVLAHTFHDYAMPLTKYHQFASVIAHGIGGLAAFESMVHYRHSPLMYSANSYVKYSLQTIGTPWYGSKLIDYYQLMTDKKRLDYALRKIDQALENVKTSQNEESLSQLHKIAKSHIEKKIKKPIADCKMNPYLKPDVVARWHAMLLQSQQVYEMAMARIATHGSYGVDSFLHDGCDWVHSVLLSETQHAPFKMGELDDMHANTFDTILSGAAYKRVWKGICYDMSEIEYPNNKSVFFEKQTKHKILNQWLFEHASRQPIAY